MFDKYYKSEYLKIKEYEKISNVSFEKFVLNIVKTQSENYPKRKESTQWIMMLLSFCFGLFIIIEGWNLFLWLGRDILSIKALLILGIPSIFVSGILLRWIFSNDLTHIDLAKFHIIDNDISLSELYLNHIISTESIAKYSKDCTDDIVKILYNETNSNSVEEFEILEHTSTNENIELVENVESISSNDTVEQLDDASNESKEDIVESSDNTEDASSSDSELLNDETIENQENDIIEEHTKEDIMSESDITEEIIDNEKSLQEDIKEEESLQENVQEENIEDEKLLQEDIEEENLDIKHIEDENIINEDSEVEPTAIYNEVEMSEKIKEALITNSLNKVESARILLKDIISIDAFEKSSPEESLNKSLKKSVYKEFKDFINDESIIW